MSAPKQPKAPFEEPIPEGGKAVGKVEKLMSPDQPSKEEQAKIADAMKKAQEERMERVVVLAREILLPVAKEMNKDVEATKVFFAILSQTLQQSMMMVMSEKNVSDLELENKINHKVPDADAVLGLLTALQKCNIGEAIEALQWMGQKIESVVISENKKRSFEDLNIDF